MCLNAKNLIKIYILLRCYLFIILIVPTRSWNCSMFICCKWDVVGFGGTFTPPMHRTTHRSYLLKITLLFKFYDWFLTPHIILQQRLSYQFHFYSWLSKFLFHSIVDVPSCSFETVGGSKIASKKFNHFVQTIGISNENKMNKQFKR